MLSQNLLFLIAFYVLGARVPAYDTPLGIEHEDGVVPTPLRQELEVIFAAVQDPLGLPLPFVVCGWFHWLLFVLRRVHNDQISMRYGLLKGTLAERVLSSPAPMFGSLATSL